LLHHPHQEPVVHLEAMKPVLSIVLVNLSPNLLTRWTVKLLKKKQASQVAATLQIRETNGLPLKLAFTMEYWFCRS
jgi:hypothetical protein